MIASRLFAAALVTAGLVTPALAQSARKPASMEARLTALEKENAELRADVDRLQKLLTQTRYDMVTTRGGVGFVPPPISPGSQPMGLAAQQAQTNAAIQAQGTQTQLNNLQLQQNMMQDRAREQQLLQPPVFGAQP
jgi:hypothetical protein